MSGWIKLHRSILDWEWYSDANAMRLFVHIMLTCNHVDKRWRGVIVPAGSRIVGTEKLANETNLTRQQVRTSLKKLESTSEITIKSTNKYTLVTLMNWESYQSTQDEPTSKVTNNQPSNNQQVTNKQPTNNHNLRKKEVKNYKNERKNISVLDFSKMPRPLTDDELSAINENRKAKRSAKLNQKTIDLAFAQIKKAMANGYTFDECIDTWIARSWVGFNASWLDTKTAQTTQETSRERAERLVREMDRQEIVVND